MKFTISQRIWGKQNKRKQKRLEEMNMHEKKKIPPRHSNVLGVNGLLLVMNALYCHL